LPALLTQVIAEVEDRIQSASSVSLFLDFDGTLVPIMADPEEARLDPDVLETLKLLSSREFLTTAMISGRAVEDLYGRIRLQNLIYAGNHGLEIFGRDLRFVEPLAWSRREQIKTLCDELAGQLRAIRGVLAEYKGLTASVHYRLAADADVAEIQATVYAAVARHGRLFRVYPGSRVLEIVPRTDWHKGAAVRWINSHLAETPMLSIYLGDDTSDEDAFSVLPDAITIKVGLAGPTCARYRLPDPAAVHEFLLRLATQQRGCAG